MKGCALGGGAGGDGKTFGEDQKAPFRALGLA